MIGSSNTASVPVRNTANSNQENHNPHQVCSQAWAWRKLPSPAVLGTTVFAMIQFTPSLNSAPAAPIAAARLSNPSQTRLRETGENAQITASV